MTLFVQTTDLPGTGAVTTTLPGPGDVLYVPEDVLISNTGAFGIAIKGASNSQRVILDGDVIGDTAIQFDSIGASVAVNAGGSVNGVSYGIRATSSLLVNNSGTITGDLNGIRGESVTTITNTGTISAVSFCIVSLGALTLINSGTIASAGTVVVASNSADTVLNTGQILGNLFLDAGDDLYDGRGGTVTGVIQLLDGNDTCIGGDGADSVRDGFGNDEIDGGGGDDLLRLDQDGQAEDTFDGGAGLDTLFFRDDSFGTSASLATGLADGGFSGSLHFSGVERLLGSGGTDTFTGDVTADTLDGRAGDDILSGDRGDDRLLGRDGDDTLNGGDGNDRLHGGTGRDTIRGDKGNDVLFGGIATDLLTGGTGNDRFVFLDLADFVAVGAGGIERITDFTQGQDLIDLSALDADSTTGADDAFTFVGFGPSTGPGQILVRQTGGNTFIDIVDFTGSSINDLRLDGLYTLTAADFVL